MSSGVESAAETISQNTKTALSDSQSLHIVASYILGNTIGRGSSAKVKYGEDVNKNSYAIKCFDKNRLNVSSRAQKQVKREINSLRLCDHPNIIRFYEVLETKDIVYLVMEYVPHGELFDYIIKLGRIPEPEAAYLAKQIISAIAHMHSRGIVHRDIKPENILVDECMQIKIADFGLSSFYIEPEYINQMLIQRQKSNAAALSSSSSTTTTKISTTNSASDNSEDVSIDTNNIIQDDDINKYKEYSVMLYTQCGSPHYAAPEILLGQPYYGPTADIWSFGILLYAMTCGSLPFTANNIQQLIYRIVSGIYCLPSYLSDDIKHLLSNLLCNIPTDRYNIKEIMNHPWFNLANQFKPPKKITPITKPITSISDDSTILKDLRSIASQQKNTQEKICVICKRKLNVLYDAQGMITIRLNDPSDDSSSLSQISKKSILNDTNENNNPSNELCTCFEDMDTLNEPSNTALKCKKKLLQQMANNDKNTMIHSPSIQYWAPPVLHDTKTILPSPREIELMEAAEKNDIAKVDQILNNSTPCPKLQAMIHDTMSSSSTSTITTTNNNLIDISKKVTSTSSITNDGNLFQRFYRRSITKDNKLQQTQDTIQSPNSTSTATNNTILTNTTATNSNNNINYTSSNVNNFEDWRLRGMCSCPDQIHRIDLRVHGMDNWTAQHYAARKGNVDIVEMQLQSCLPLDINCQTKNKWTPLMLAADQGHLEVVNLLLQYNADIHRMSSDGKTAIFLTHEQKYDTISQRLTEVSSARHRYSLQHQVIPTTTTTTQDVLLDEKQKKLLLSLASCKEQEKNNTVTGAINSPNNNNNNEQMSIQSNNTTYTSTSQQAEITKACEEGDIQKVQRLVELSTQVQMYKSTKSKSTITSSPQCDLFAKGIDNWTLFHSAARYDRWEIILFLIETLASCKISLHTILSHLNSTTKNGWTALMMASDRGNIKTVEFLVNRCNVDVFTIAHPNDSALTLALERAPIEPYPQIVSIIRRAMRGS